jgi:hypothetical protein
MDRGDEPIANTYLLLINCIVVIQRALLSLNLLVCKLKEIESEVPPQAIAPRQNPRN